MDLNSLTAGQAVYFGRSNGEKSLGRVAKVNRKKAMVEQMTKRGSLKDYPVGTIWAVSPALISPAPQEALAQFATPDPTARPKKVVDLGGNEPRKVRPTATMAPAAPSRRVKKATAPEVQATPVAPETPKKTRRAPKAKVAPVVETQAQETPRPEKQTRKRAPGYGSKRPAEHSTSMVHPVPPQSVPVFTDPTNRLRIEGHPGESTEDFHARLGKILGNWEKRHKAEFAPSATKTAENVAHNVH